MVGSAICRQLASDDRIKVLTAPRADLDLCCQKAVSDFFSSSDIDFVYLAAAKVGGINANNTYPAEFIYQNLMIQSNVIDAKPSTTPDSNGSPDALERLAKLYADGLLSEEEFKAAKSRELGL